MTAITERINTLGRSRRSRIQRKLIALSATIVLLGLFPVIGGPVATAEAAHGAKYEKSAARHTNAERTSRGLVKLRWSACLDRYAEAQAKRMAQRQSLQHQRLRPILSQCGLRSTGENIAVGYRSGKAVTRAWMASPDHRENILRKEYRNYGLGAHKDSHGRWWVSHVFGRKA
ncbi:CAP domain-containing protein [Microlunatus soli]|uniref:Uncharacterized conserved protein YkwD, contains CAP (CSP/antigen 5/PR1) domain n=1 Tax=Microlunatus soli TaxID=630515 RepID=A0A1H1MSY8_9ACTN|nr:CAP domain-containing protein [Microlunatus soli]SDR89495.1 Uncharacterized conserved protein YkwD, contains CAP (CSP/antigen 5/PR1) domain [Microlunatus soli]